MNDLFDVDELIRRAVHKTKFHTHLLYSGENYKIMDTHFIRSSVEVVSAPSLARFG